MDLSSIIIATISLISGGSIGVFFTVKSVKRKSSAEADQATNEAKAKELDNVQEAITIYREMADALKIELKSANDDRSALRDELEESRKERAEMMQEVGKLRKQIAQLTIINKKIFETLDKITPDNLEQMIEQLKRLNNG